MTRREKIIEILENNLCCCTDYGDETPIGIKEAADKILALDNPTWELPDEDIIFQGSVTDYLKEHKPPLDVPDNKEIMSEAMTYSSYPAMPDGQPEFEPSRAEDFDNGAHWMRDEIIRRNVSSRNDSIK